MLRSFLAALVGVSSVLTGAVAPASAAPLDRAIAGGRFYSQATGGDGSLGYRVTNDGDVKLWDEYQRLGGVDALGYPVSRRFQWKGFTVQAMQKGVLQWRPESGKAWLTNVFDEMHDSGKDEWLKSARATPPPLPGSFDAGKDWAGVLQARMKLLDANPAIKAAYFAAPDPLTFFGLPTSEVVDNGNHYAIRLQRAVIQQWKQDVPWAKAGQVTIANGADIAKEAGLFPADVLKPQTAEGADPAPPPAADPMPAADAAKVAPAAAKAAPALASSQAQAAVDRVNYYRGLMGLTPLRLDPALTKAAQAHADYYAQNSGDGSMVGMGLHHETAGKPGFTGAEWGARATAAGWSGGPVDENVGLVADPVRTIDAFTATINHRWNLLHPWAVALGYGINSDKPIDVFDIGFAASSPVGNPAVYPAPNQGGIPISSGLWETPDPAPGVPRPVGYPLTVTLPLRANVEWGQPSLVDDAGAPVDIAVNAKAWLRGQSIVPKAPLRAGATYKATVRGKVDGKPFEYSWSFATR